MNRNKSKTTSSMVIGLLVGALLGSTVAWQAMKPGTEGTNQATTALQRLPDETASQALVRDTTLRFANAVNAHDLGRFRADTSREFRDAFSLERFQQSFGGFIDQKIDLTVVKNLQPVFTDRSLQLADQTLALSGHFPTQPSRVDFDYKYQWQDGAWRLTGINIAVVPIR